MSFVFKLLNWFSGGVFKTFLDRYFKHLETKAASKVESERVQAEKTIQTMKAATDVSQAWAASKWFWIGWLVFVLPTGFYYAWILIVDKILNMGATDPLTGFIAQWAQMIVESMFLPGAIVGGAGILASMLRR